MFSFSKCDILVSVGKIIFIYSDLNYVLFIRDGNWGVTLVVSEQVGLSGQVVVVIVERLLCFVLVVCC